MVLEQHFIEDLSVWRHKIRGVKHASLPPVTSRSNPLVVGDLVIASVFSPGMIYAVDKDTGRFKWRVKMDGLGSASVTVAGGMVYGETSHTIYAIDPLTGRKIWELCPYGTKRERIYSSPTIVGGLLFFGDRCGLFHCLDARTGKHRWWVKTSRAKNRDVNSTAVYHNGMIIVATNSRLAIAYEPKTGRQIWKQRIDSPSGHGLSIFDGNIFLNSGRSVYLLDPDTGMVVDRFSRRGESIWNTAIFGNTVLIISKLERLIYNPPKGGYGDNSIMRCLRKGRVLYERPASDGICGFSRTRRGGLIYKSRVDGLGVIQTKTGERIHNIICKRDLLHPGIVDVQKDKAYLLAMDGAIYSFRHP